MSFVHLDGQKREEERFDEANRNLTKTQLFTNRVMTFMMPGMMMIMNVLSVGIVWGGCPPKIDAGTTFTSVVAVIFTSPKPLWRISQQRLPVRKRHKGRCR